MNVNDKTFQMRKKYKNDSDILMKKQKKLILSEKNN